MKARQPGPGADLLRFLESCGFRFALTAKGVAFQTPPLLRCMAAQVTEVLPAIRMALLAREVRPATAAAASRPGRQPKLGEPALLHRKRGEWDAYVFCGELHAVFAGVATNEREARASRAREICRGFPVDATGRGKLKDQFFKEEFSMLVIGRRRDEGIWIDGPARPVSVVKVFDNGNVRLGIEAERDVAVERDEVRDRRIALERGLDRSVHTPTTNR